MLPVALFGCVPVPGSAGDDTGEESGDADESLPPLEPRPSAVDCKLLGTPAGALPRLQAELVDGPAFDEPVQLVAHPEGLVVAEASGRVWRVVDGVREPEPWLDLGAAVAGAPTRGLLAIAFDEQWLYAHFQLASSPQRARVVRIPIPAQGPLDPAQALTMLDIDHGDAGLDSGAVGGALALDEQGRVLIGVGEGTASAAMWPEDAPAQDRSDWRGSVLRVVAPADPQQAGYAIPPDNPWIGDAAAQPELFAIGLHDPRHLVLGEGTWWVGDSGTGVAEELSRVDPGANLGWPVIEGRTCTGLGECDLSEYAGPSFQYAVEGDHCRIVAGAWVVGGELPSLAGALVWADHCSGRLWGYDPTPAQGLPKTEVLGRVPAGVAAIGRDGAGEPWLIDGEGRLARLRLAEHGLPGSLPERLSETGCFAADLVTPTPGLIPYLVASPLWSDGLLKQRHMVLPPELHVERVDEGRWQFPDGSVLIKTFVLEAIEGDATTRRPIETRFMVRRDGVWDFHSYRWRVDGSDADRLADGASVELTVETESGDESFVWEFPSEIGCRNCHGFGEAEPLGPNDLQMNRVVRYGEHEREQLSALAEIGLFAAPVADELGEPRLVDPLDADAPLEQRARAYLHANCAHCHQPKWMRPDLRWTTSFAETHTCGEAIEFPSPDVGGALRIAPGDPQNSNLWLRMATRGKGQMPLLGSGRVDASGLELIEAWIEGLDECP